jgi:energy-converting hydrogenase Eha subunit E
MVRLKALSLLYTGSLLALIGWACQPNTESDRSDPRLFLQLDTELGTIHCTLLSHRTPHTIALIKGLAEGTIAFRDPRSGLERRGRYYDGLKFFRRIPGVMVQIVCRKTAQILPRRRRARLSVANLPLCCVLRPTLPDNSRSSVVVVTSTLSADSLMQNTNLSSSA